MAPFRVAPRLKPRTRAGRAALAEADLSPAGREFVASDRKGGPEVAHEVPTSVI